MDRMATRTDDVGSRMRTAPNVGPAKVLSVALQTSVERFLRAQLGKGDDLRLVAFGFDMRFTRTVAALAALLLKLQFLIGRGLEVSIAEEGGRDVRVASPAHQTAGITRGESFLRSLCLHSPRRKQTQTANQNYSCQQEKPLLVGLYGRGRRIGTRIFLWLLFAC